MEKRREYIVALLERYKSGSLSDGDELIIESLLEKGEIDLDQLGDLRLFEDKVMKMETPETSAALNDRFYEMLAVEKRSLRSPGGILPMFSWESWFARLAFGMIVFIAGLALGYAVFNEKTSDTSEMTALSNEVKSLREMMMLSLLEKESATDRLKAVSLSQEMDQSSVKVIDALVKTLNNDENVNVRLAALDALKAYAHRSEVRQELIKAISKQDSPLVQIALADLMASLQAKSSVKEFDKLLKDDRTPEDVKQRIRKSIEVLS